MEHVVLGVDGDHGYALWGANLQEGEAVFIKIQASPGAKDWGMDAMTACRKAYAQLQRQFPNEDFLPVWTNPHPYLGVK